jgi:DNA-binding IclR family transcriptional regulator
MEVVLLITDAVQRLKGVFLEVPGTRVTLADASRLLGLDHSMCQAVLTALEDARFLKCGRDGRYQQLTDLTHHTRNSHART